MSDASSSTNQAANNLEERLSLIENALKLDERILGIETALKSKKNIYLTNPWWRDAKTVTVLGALIAAVIPLVTVIDGILKNARESQRATIEQQDKIRQTYLDRVLKPGITEGEQRRIFGLLLKLKGDPEFQEWAKEQFDAAGDKINELKKLASDLEAQKKELINQLEFEKQRSLVGQQKTRSKLKVQQLEREVAQTQKKVDEIGWRTIGTFHIHPPGETGGWIYMDRSGNLIATPAKSSEAGETKTKCECPNIPGSEHSCDKPQIAICTEQEGKCIGRCIPPG